MLERVQTVCSRDVAEDVESLARDPLCHVQPHKRVVEQLLGHVPQWNELGDRNPCVLIGEDRRVNAEPRSDLSKIHTTLSQDPEDGTGCAHAAGQLGGHSRDAITKWRLRSPSWRPRSSTAAGCERTMVHEVRP